MCLIVQVVRELQYVYKLLKVWGFLCILSINIRDSQMKKQFASIIILSAIVTTTIAAANIQVFAIARQPENKKPPTPPSHPAFFHSQTHG